VQVGCFDVPYKFNGRSNLRLSLPNSLRALHVEPCQHGASQSSYEDAMAKLMLCRIYHRRGPTGEVEYNACNDIPRQCSECQTVWDIEPAGTFYTPPTPRSRFYPGRTWAAALQYMTWSCVVMCVHCFRLIGSSCTKSFVTSQVQGNNGYLTLMRCWTATPQKTRSGRAGRVGRVLQRYLLNISNITRLTSQDGKWYLLLKTGTLSFISGLFWS
jgi:hypothetical protein